MSLLCVWTWENRCQTRQVFFFHGYRWWRFQLHCRLLLYKMVRHNTDTHKIKIKPYYFSWSTVYYIPPLYVSCIFENISPVCFFFCPQNCLLVLHRFWIILADPHRYHIFYIDCFNGILLCYRDTILPPLAPFCAHRFSLSHHGSCNKRAIAIFWKKNATCFSALSTEKERKMDDFIWKKRILPWERGMVQIHHHFWKQMCCWLSVCSEFHKYLVTSLSPYTFFSKFLMFFTKSFASTRDIIQSLSDLFWIYVCGWLGI